MNIFAILYTFFMIIVVITCQGCSLPRFGTVSVGTRIQKIGTCTAIECRENNVWIELQCAILGVRETPNHSFKTDLTKQYPDCCEQYTEDKKC